MAQPPPDQNFYHPHAHPHAHPHPQLQLPPQFRNPFDLLFDERTGAINYNYIRPYIPNQLQKPDDLSDPLVMRRPRRTRTTFTSAQIAELEQHFLQGRYLTSSRLAELSAKLALGTAQVKIWFKNRRRRHKIQSDQHKDYSSCDGMPGSPSVSNSIKTEGSGSASASSCSSNSSSGSSSGGPPSLQSLSLNGGGEGTTPNPLTPSPTPTTPTTNVMEHYVEPAFNPYYYNNHHASHPHQPHHGPGALSHPYAGTAGAAGAQYYPPPPRPAATLQHHQPQQQQAQYHTSPHPHQFQMQHKPQLAIKQDPDYNFNNPYYMRMPSGGGGHNATANPGVTTVEPSSAMSPNSEVYEPLTPKNDETSSMCSANNGDVGDVDLNETKTKLRVLVSNNANGGTDDTCRNTNGMGNENSGNPPDVNIMEDCTGAFAKYQKIPNGGDPNDPNYQCTMDTIMHAYSNHRTNTAATNQQYAYCFN